MDTSSSNSESPKPSSTQANYLAPSSDLIPEQLNPNQTYNPNLTYPTKRVIISYTLLGGVVGGLIVCLIVGIFSGFGLRQVFGYSVLGSIVGVIPAAMTAIIIVYNKIYLVDTTDYVKIFGIGAAVSFVLALLLGDIMFVPIIIMIGIIGGLSSVIVGWFFIPRDYIKVK